MFFIELPYGIQLFSHVRLFVSPWTAIWSRNPTRGIYPEKTLVQKDICISVFIAALFTIANTWKQPKCSLTDEQV